MAPKKAAEKEWQAETETQTAGRKVVVIAWNVSEHDFVEAKQKLNRYVSVIRPDEVRQGDSIVVTCKSMAAVSGLYVMYRV